MAKQTFTTGQVLTAAQMTSLQQTAMGGGSTTAKTVSYTLVAADAGTVIQMNSASATTITVNTALFSAGDTVQIQNIGAGVCTITAGTATVNTAGSLALSQYEGGQLYFNTTSAALFFDVVQAGASGYVALASAVSLGTTISKQITGLSGYSSYIILLSGATMAATSELRMTVNNDSTSGRYFRNDTNASGTYWTIRAQGSGTAYYYGFTVQGDATSMKVTTGDNNLTGGGYNQTGAISSLEFIAGGTLWTAGTVSIYGKA